MAVPITPWRWTHVTLVVLVMFPVSQGIKCYSCYTFDQPVPAMKACKEADLSSSDVTVKNCDKTISRCAVLRFKARQDDNKKIVEGTIRDCDPDPDFSHPRARNYDCGKNMNNLTQGQKIWTQVYKMKGNVTDAKICYCDSDKCNQSSFLVSSQISIAIALTTGFSIHLRK